MERNLDNSTAADQTTEKIPHSGNLPGSLRETPVQHFDTPLADAPVNPLDMHDFTPTDVLPVVEKSNNRKKLLIGASAGLAGVALVAGSIIGINAAKSNENTPPVTDPKETVDVTESPVEPSSPEAPVEIEAPAVSEIEAGLEAKVYASEYLEMSMAWQNASAKDTLLEDSNSLDKTWEEYIPELVEENKNLYADALFVSNWRGDTKLVAWAEKRAETNENTLWLYASTAWSQEYKPENVEAFKRSITLDSAEELESSEDGRVIRVAFTSTHNGDKNSAGVSVPGQDIVDITTVIENGSEKISGYHYLTQ